MPAPRHCSPRLRHRFAPALLLLRVTQVAGVSCLLSLGFLTAVPVPDHESTPPMSVDAPLAYEVEVEDAMTRYQCFAHGLTAEEIPSSALIRTNSGKINHVTFDRGWAVHTRSKNPATLIAVCASEPSRR